MTDHLSRFSVTLSDGTDMTPQLQRFAEIIGLDRIAPERYSLLLLLGLYGAKESGKQNPFKIIQEIKALEDPQIASNLKPATQFKHPPLKGLWHKHYLQDGIASMALNLRKGMDRYKLPWVEQRIAEAKAANEKRFFSMEDAAHIARDAVSDNWKRLTRDSVLTGEWLIYARYQNANYYLCLGKHQNDDAELRRQIDAICLHEFPFLSQILDQTAN
ncbi:hypothetical protein Fraau_1986 [Frateuria aurantia DSM 6220]|uniref:Uncharacterized protein n=2 Tax=Frateuria aurantia TaxID=81475 RepID=H8L1W2_FRAAD|nr:hypothetical protein Fraau_1986 [Frateuria aurantia DSM 6220]